MTVAELIVNRFADKRRLAIIAVEVSLLSLHYYFSSIELVGLAFPTGFASYILIPGFLLVSNLRFLFSDRDIVMDLIFGFSLPILIISGFWGFHVEPINFRVIVPLLVSLLVLIMVFTAPRDFTSRFRKNYLTKSILIVMILAIVVRSYYFSVNSSSIAIDGGLYSDTARTIVTKGEFSSKILNSDPTNPYFNFEGFMNYPITVFSIATFFLIGGASFVSAKLATVFIGFLVVLMIYKISSELFGKKTALMAGLISAILPLLSYYSVILYGPEILSALFALASLYFFLRGIKSESRLPVMVLPGLFAALTFGAWGLIPFFTLVASLSLIYILYHFRGGIKSILYSFFLLVAIFFIYKFSAIPVLEALFLGIPLLFLFILWKKVKSSNFLKITVFVSAVILSLQLFFVHSYLASHPYITGMEHIIVPLPDTFMSNPLKSLNPFSLPLGINISSTYIVDSFGRFWQSLATILGSFLFVLFVIAFISPSKYKEKIVLLIFPCVGASIFVLTFTSNQFWFGDILSDRFLVLPACFIVILSSRAITTLLNSSKLFASRSFRVSVSTINKKAKLRLNKSKTSEMLFAVILLIITVSLIPIHLSYLMNFDVGYLSVTNWYGEVTLDWIKNSTLPTDVFCAADSNRLALFTNRVFVDSAVTSGTFDVPALINLVTQFKINYVIVDTFFVNYRSHTSFFDNLYKTPMELGQETPLLQENFVDGAITAVISSKNSTYTQDSYGLRLVFEYSNDLRTVRIFQAVHSSFSMNIKFIDATFVNNWSPKRGNFTIDNDGARVSTTMNNDWAYVFLNNSQTLPSLSSNSFLAVKLRGNDNTAKFWITFVDAENNWFKIQEDTNSSAQFQVYNYNLDKIMGHNMTSVYLGVSGDNITSVSYDWVVIYDLVTKKL